MVAHMVDFLGLVAIVKEVISANMIFAKDNAKSKAANTIVIVLTVNNALIVKTV